MIPFEGLVTAAMFAAGTVAHLAEDDAKQVFAALSGGAVDEPTIHTLAIGLVERSFGRADTPAAWASDAITSAVIAIYAAFHADRAATQDSVCLAVYAAARAWGLQDAGAIPYPRGDA